MLVHMKHNKLSFRSRFVDNAAQHNVPMYTVSTVIVMMAIGDYVVDGNICFGHHIVNSVAAAIPQAQSIPFQCQLPTAKILSETNKAMNP